ncbi:hypothetical protein C2S52_008094 [Perilla frutescens var. hirtella]|nr:hypothetical protein C2S52_008094 [Perilla frutescens var. hirtella]
MADDRNEKFDDNEHTEMIMKWLSRKDRSSTVYVSFGSECFLSKEQIAEIAKGLQLCDVNFIWAIRFPVGANAVVEDELPEGFLDVVRERGMVVEWAPQTKILEHPSVGAFVSHSGWNSIMEGI